MSERAARLVMQQDNATLWEFSIDGKVIDLTWVRDEIFDAIQALNGAPLSERYDYAEEKADEVLRDVCGTGAEGRVHLLNALAAAYLAGAERAYAKREVKP